MKTYQTLSLIGSIIGIFLMLFLFGIAGIGTVFNNASMNLTKQYGNGSQIMTQQQKHDASEKSFSAFAGGTALSLLLFIIAIPITFIVKNGKGVGIVLIAFGIISMVITNGWGIIPFCLLLPAGILAIKESRKPTTTTNHITR
jgi:hypothetical protein